MKNSPIRNYINISLNMYLPPFGPQAVAQTTESKNFPQAVANLTNSKIIKGAAKP